MHTRHKYYPRTIQQKLGYLVEECGEVMAAVGKAQRWGLDSYNPDIGPDSETNRAWILRELGDLRQACEIVREALEWKVDYAKLAAVRAKLASRRPSVRKEDLCR